MKRLSDADRRLPLAAVRRALLDRCLPVAEELRSPAAAVDCVLARDEKSVRPLPADPIALVDGWPVTAADTFAASPFAPVVIDDGCPILIGEPAPANRDAVVPGDVVIEELGRTMVQTPVAPGENLRRVGEDGAIGRHLLVAGRRLSPLGATLAELLGLPAIAVRVPRILVVHDSEREAEGAARLLATAMRRNGAACRTGVLDAPGDFREAPSHLIIAVGGAAIGPRDPALAWAARREGWRAIGRPAMRPGDTVVCGQAADGPVIVVPSRLDAVLSMVLLIARPIVDALSGANDVVWRQTRPLARKIASSVGISEVVLLADADEGRAWAPIGVGDFDWIEGARALAFAEIPPESEGAGAGEPFAATMLAGPGAAGLWSDR